MPLSTPQPGSGVRALGDTVEDLAGGPQFTESHRPSPSGRYLDFATVPGISDTCGHVGGSIRHRAIPFLWPLRQQRTNGASRR